LVEKAASADHAATATTTGVGKNGFFLYKFPKTKGFAAKRENIVRIKGYGDVYEPKTQDNKTF